MFGPFGVDAFALTNALSLLQELITRVQAPRELLRTAAYLSDRRSKLLPHLNDDGDAAARSVPLASSKLLDQHAFLVPSQRDQSASGGLLPPRVLRAARIFLTRDSLHDVLQAVSRLQNDELLERLLIKQTQIGLRLDSIENAVNTMPFLSNLISPCSQVESAGKIQNLPVLRLKGLSVRERKDYTSIHTPLPPDSPVSTPTRPIWPPASASPPLFSNSQQLDLRFELLLSVATSLAAAHSFGWYHTFLAPTMIRIPIHPTSAHTHPPVVLNFLHRGKGCKACGSCTENPLPPPKPDDPFSFRDVTAALDSVRTPEEEDRLIFGNFVCWVYSTTLFDYAHPRSEHNLKRLMCVPWPLRMLVTDALQIPLEVAHLWLSKLKNRTIDPDSLQPPFCPYPAPYNLSSTPVSTSLNGHHPSKPPFKTEDQVLQECRLRSVVTASETAEPQAALHLAIHFELHHKHLARQQFGKHQDAVTQFCHAYDYYLAAAKLGSVPALVHVARLQSRALHFHWQYVEISPTPTVESVLALLLAAAFQGSVQAFQALPRVMDDGVFNALKPFEPSLDTRAAKSGRSFAEQNCVIERELFNVTYRVALDLRVGTKHLPQREDLAVALLHIAHRRRHSRSSLELGLYMVQTARSFEEARAGMDILSKLTNTDAHEGLQACFRLGRWLYYGLPHEFACSNGRITASTQHSNRQQGRQRQENMDHDQATCLVKTAAEGGLREAMVLYGTLLKKWAARHPDQGYLDEGNYWIKKAGTCPMAYYAKALLLIYEAESSFKPRCKMTGAESFGSTTSGSNPGTSNASSANMSSSTPSRIGSKKSKKRGEKKKLLKWLQNSSSGALEVIEKPNRSTLSAETLTQDASQIEDNAMNKAIQKKFEKVYNILVDGPAALAKDFPGENLNPYPYYKAAEFMIGFGYIWADCDPSKTEAGLKEEARILLKKVTEIPRSHDPTTWEHLRRNWRQEDMFYVRKARDLETKMFK